MTKLASEVSLQQTAVPTRTRSRYRISAYPEQAPASRASLRPPGSLLRAVLLVVVLIPFPLGAQIDTGGLTGTVKDPSGAVVPGAHVTLLNQQTGVAQEAISTSTGTYVFESVKAGTYTLKAQFSGFRPFKEEGIEINVQHVDTVDVPFMVGSNESEVTVAAAAPLLQTESAAVGQTIEGKQINDLPLNGRDWASLAQLSAGVTTSSTNFSGAPGSAYFSIDGANVWTTDFRLNGIDDNVELYGGENNTNVNVTPPPDAIQEFALQNANFDAEFGHSVGGIINAVMKSGTNKFHGSLWEYVRNNDIQANDYFSNQAGKPRAPYHQNQFGATIGGPVRIPHLYNGQDKTFFFADYQGLRQIIPLTYTNSVPTALEQSSGFTNLSDLISGNGTSTKTDGLGRIFPKGAVLDPRTTRNVAAGAVDPVSGFANKSAKAVNVRDPFFTGAGIAGIMNFVPLAAQLNRIPAARLDPVAIKLLQLYPVPTSAGIVSNYFATPGKTTNQNQYDIRIDHSQGEKDTIFGVFDWSHYNISIPNALPGIAEGGTYGTGSNYIPVYSIAVGESHIFSAHITNEFHAGWSKNLQHLLNSSANIPGLPAQYGIPGVPQTQFNGGLPLMKPSGLTSLGAASSMPTLQTITALELLDNVTIQRGSHTFKVGGQFDKFYGNVLQPSYSHGLISFNGQYSDVPDASTSLLGISDFLLTPGASTAPTGYAGITPAPANLGGSNSFSGSSTSPNRTRRYFLGAYFQDDWKVTPTLTLNLGLRWDHFTPYAEIGGRQANFVQSGNGNGPTATYYIPNQGCAIPRSAAFNALVASSNITIQCSSSLTLGNAQSTNFAPRLGFAERVTPKFVVRGGYGIAYGALANIGFSPTIGNNYPFVYVNTFNSANSETPFLTPAGTVATVENAFASVNVSDPTLVTPQGLSFKGRQYNFQTPYNETFNLFAQYQFTNHDSIEAGYVGTVGRHLDSLGIHNAPSEILPPGTNTQLYVPFPSFAASSRYETTTGSSSYNAMQMTYEHRTQFGLSLLANYTVSKCMTSQGFYASLDQNYRAQWLPGFGVGGDYSLCDTDATNVVHISEGYTLPVGRGQMFLQNVNRAVDAVLGGWVFNSIYTFQGGQPFPVGCPVATTASGDFGCYANEVPGVNPYAGGHTQQQWLNPKAFSQPPLATTIGQTDYSPLGGAPLVVRGPHLSNMDASLFKQFSIEPVGRLEFRAEAFNLTNTAEFGNPGQLNFTTSGFSKITALRNNQRLLQLALKLYF